MFSIDEDASFMILGLERVGRVAMVSRLGRRRSSCVPNILTLESVLQGPFGSWVLHGLTGFLHAHAPSVFFVLHLGR